MASELRHLSAGDFYKETKRKENSQWGRYGQMTGDTNQYRMFFLLDHNYYFDLLPSVCDSLSGCL